MKTIQEMREMFNNGELNLLTIEAVRDLKGKKIATIYFGYRGQDDVDEFVVGETINELALARMQECDGYSNRAEYWKSYMSEQQLKRYENRILLLREDGTTTSLGYDPELDWDNSQAFTGSDADRYVFYTECR